MVQLLTAAFLFFMVLSYVCVRVVYKRAAIQDWKNVVGGILVLIPSVAATFYILNYLYDDLKTHENLPQQSHSIAVVTFIFALLFGWCCYQFILHVRDMTVNTVYGVLMSIIFGGIGLGLIYISVTAT